MAHEVYVSDYLDLPKCSSFSGSRYPSQKPGPTQRDTTLEGPGSAFMIGTLNHTPPKSRTKVAAAGAGIEP